MNNSNFASGGGYANTNPGAINPSFLAASFNKQPPPPSGPSINPAQLMNGVGGGSINPAQLMNGVGGSVNPQQLMNGVNPALLMNGGGGGGGAPAGSFTPGQLLSMQHQYQQPQPGQNQGMGSMNPAMMNAAGMSGGINPANLNMSAGMNPNSMSGPGSSHPNMIPPTQAMNPGMANQANQLTMMAMQKHAQGMNNGMPPGMNQMQMLMQARMQQQQQQQQQQQHSPHQQHPPEQHPPPQHQHPPPQHQQSPLNQQQMAALLNSHIQALRNPQLSDEAKVKILQQIQQLNPPLAQNLQQQMLQHKQQQQQQQQQQQMQQSQHSPTQMRPPSSMSGPGWPGNQPGQSNIRPPSSSGGSMPPPQQTGPGMMGRPPSSAGMRPPSSASSHNMPMRPPSSASMHRPGSSASGVGQMRPPSASSMRQPSATPAPPHQAGTPMRPPSASTSQRARSMSRSAAGSPPHPGTPTAGFQPPPIGLAGPHVSGPGMPPGGHLGMQQSQHPPPPSNLGPQTHGMPMGGMPLHGSGPHGVIGAPHNSMSSHHPNPAMQHHTPPQTVALHQAPGMGTHQNMPPQQMSMGRPSSSGQHDLGVGMNMGGMGMNAMPGMAPNMGAGPGMGPGVGPLGGVPPGAIPPGLNAQQQQQLAQMQLAQSAKRKAPENILPGVLPTPIKGIPPMPGMVPPGMIDPASNPAFFAPHLPALPNLPIMRTRLDMVAPGDIPELSQEEIADIVKWKKADEKHEELFREMRRRGREEAAIAPRWWEMGGLPSDPARAKERFDVRYPKRGKDTRKKGKREGLRPPRRVKDEDAAAPEMLIPIRLEFDVDHHKFRDTFIWNINDAVVTPEIFAQSIVDDYALQASHVTTIARSINEQIADYHAHAPDNQPEEEVIHGDLTEPDVRWWNTWRKRCHARSRSRKRARMDFTDDEDVIKVEDEELRNVGMMEDMRIVIKLDIIVGSMKLDDQFEWDLDNEIVAPERFAETYCMELGLGGEFKTAIAHAIREQVHTYEKSLYVVGRPSTGPADIPDEELRSAFLPTVKNVARPTEDVPNFMPVINYLSDSEIERTEREREKEIGRRKKRAARNRRGVTLPDREPLPTQRTPAIGFPELNAAALAAANMVTAPTSRRAAAAAAATTIANMVASENGEMTPSRPVAAAPQTEKPQKEKKSKGHFKAPPFPPSVLRPRASVVAPIPSTAAGPSSGEAVLLAEPQELPRVSAKRLKELEREIKEKEYAETQHENMIDGVWHCSNCGCPDNIAIGRRKGPLGDKTQCGTCGKYWHRYRRPMAVEYNTSAEHHLNKGKVGEHSRSRRKRGAGQEANTEPNTPAPPARAGSPSSSSSSGEEAPLAQRVRANGTVSRAAELNPKMEPVTPQPTNGSTAPLSSGGTKALPPPWLVNAKTDMLTKYPNDKFDYCQRKVGNMMEWRLRCTDCPGKTYTPGPGETLTNFEVHLKNRVHRERVNARLQGNT